MSTAKAVLDALMLREVGENQFRGNSPFRHGSDSDSFTLTIHDDEHGAYYDHVEGIGGTLYELAKRLDIAITSNPTDTRKARTFEDFAADHGVTVEDYRRAGWSATTYKGKAAISFTTATGTRWRILSADGSKYESQRGYKASWYRLDHAVVMANGGGFPLVLCNGEASTVAAQVHGVPATCITGGAERQIPEALLEELQRQYTGDIMVALDCDDKGKAAARKLYAQLKGAGYVVRMVDLNLPAKGDLADYLRLWSPASLYALEDVGQTEYLTALPKTISASEMQRHEPPPIEYLIDDLMVPGLYLLAGAPKSRKSFLALHCAIAVATGGKVFQRFEVPKAHGVLYLDLEMNSNSVWRRINGMMPNATWPSQLYFGFGDDWPYRGMDALSQLDAWLDAHRHVRVVVIDVLAQWRDHVDPRTPVYTADYDALKPLQRFAGKRNVAIVVVHHTNKSKIIKGDDPFDKISGSTGIQGAVDAMWLLTKDHDNPYATILQTRDRNINDVERVDLTWDEFLGAHAVDPKLRLLQSTSAERRQIYDILNDASATMTPSEIAQQISKSVDVVKKLLARLVQDKLVTKSGYGLYTAVPILNTIHSVHSVHSIHSVHSVHSMESDIQEGMKSEQEGVRVNGSESRVNGEFTALESSEVGKSEQSERLLYRERILQTIARLPMASRVMTIVSQITVRANWPVYEAVIDEMLADGTLVAEERQGWTYISIRKRTDEK